MLLIKMEYNIIKVEAWVEKFRFFVYNEFSAHLLQDLCACVKASMFRQLLIFVCSNCCETDTHY